MKLLQPFDAAGQLTRKYPVFYFVASAGAIIVLFYIFYRNPWLESHIFSPMVHFYALLSGNLLALIGYANSVNGDVIFSSGFSVGIKKGCDAAEPMAIFVAGVLAFPSLLRQKFIGLAIGLFIMFILNIARITTLFLVGINFPDFFESMHIAVWQVVFILVAVGLWFLWLRYVLIKPHKP